MSMISQGSSEHSICFVVPGNVGERAQKAVERAFFAERHYGQVQTVELVPDCWLLKEACGSSIPFERAKLLFDLRKVLICAGACKGACPPYPVLPLKMVEHSLCSRARIVRGRTSNWLTSETQRKCDGGLSRRWRMQQLKFAL